MRFKKLKTFIAIALVIAILVIANIFVFGSLQNKQLLANVDNKKSTGTNSAVVSSNNTTQQTQNNPEQNTQTSTQPVASDNTPVVVTHPAMRTRAS